MIAIRKAVLANPKVVVAIVIFLIGNVVGLAGFQVWQGTESTLPIPLALLERLEENEILIKELSARLDELESQKVSGQLERLDDKVDELNRSVTVLFGLVLGDK